MKEETRGLFLAVILSVIAILVTNYLFPKAPAAPQPQQEPEIAASAELQTEDAGKIIVDETPLTTAEAVASEKRIKFANTDIHGSIRLKGARFDELYLSKYKTGLEKDSPDIELLSPSRTAAPYYAEFGWLSNDRNLKLPDGSTVWQAKTGELTPENPLVLEYNNGQGLRFIRKISLDKNYMFNIEQSIENNTAKSVSLFPYGLISRTVNNGKDSDSAVVHEGMLGVIDSSLKEKNILRSRKKAIRKNSKPTAAGPDSATVIGLVLWSLTTTKMPKLNSLKPMTTPIRLTTLAMPRLLPPVLSVHRTSGFIPAPKKSNCWINTPNNTTLISLIWRLTSAGITS